MTALGGLGGWRNLAKKERKEKELMDISKSVVIVGGGRRVEVEEVMAR